MGKATKSGNTAKAGISGTSTTKATNSKSEANSQTTYSKDAFIDAYISDRLAGGTPETATTAGRTAAGMSTTPAGNSAADRALASGDAYVDPTTGRVNLFDSVNQAAGNRTYGQYEQETTPEERYVSRVRDTQAAQTPRFSETSGNRKSLLAEIIDANGRQGLNQEYVDYALSPENGGGFGADYGGIAGYGKWRSGIEPSSGTDWTSQTPLPTGGGDGAPRGQEDQVGRKPDEVVTRGIEIGGKQLTPKTTKVYTSPADTPERPESTPLQQYLYPEEGGSIRYQSLNPFEDWQKELIDEMNTAFENRDFSEQYRLSRIYNGGPESYMQEKYSRGLPEGTDPYDAIRDAISADDRMAYDDARNTLRSNGFSQDQIDNQAAEVIHRSDMSAREKENALQNYLGLSVSDAQASAALWWWTDNNGRDAADSDGNGRLKQDELGNYLMLLENGGTFSEAQAAAIWKESFPTAKTTYSTWKGKKKK